MSGALPTSQDPLRGFEVTDVTGQGPSHLVSAQVVVAFDPLAGSFHGSTLSNPSQLPPRDTDRRFFPGIPNWQVLAPAGNTNALTGVLLKSDKPRSLPLMLYSGGVAVIPPGRNFWLWTTSDDPTTLLWLTIDPPHRRFPLLGVRSLDVCRPFEGAPSGRCPTSARVAPHGLGLGLHHCPGTGWLKLPKARTGRLLLPLHGSLQTGPPPQDGSTPSLCRFGDSYYFGGVGSELTIGYQPDPDRNPNCAGTTVLELRG